nr:hypothetical protein [Candidatus Sigynarchaeum springense]
MKASFGAVNITPEDVVGRPLAGYTPIPRCTGKYDDIHARAVLIEDVTLGNVKKRLLLISMDVLQIPMLFSDYIKEQIQDAYKIHPNQILIHAIHTHKSLDMSGMFARIFKKNGEDGLSTVIWNIMFGAYHGDDRYKVWIARRIVAMVGEMIAQLRPARIAWTKQIIDSDIIINRRHPTRRSRSPMGIIAFKDAKDGELFGFIVNYGMHPTTLSRGITKLSADYPGRVVYKVSELTGGKVQAICFTAPAGDLNPITTCGTEFEKLDKNRDPVYNQTGTYKDTKRLGYFLGERALEIARSIPDEDFFDTISFKSYVRTFWVPMRDFKKYFSKSWLGNRLVHLVKRYILFPVALLLSDANEPNFPGFAAKHRGFKWVCAYTQIQYIGIDAWGKKGRSEVAIIGVPGELFEDIAKVFYEKTPAGPANTFIFQTSNDWIAYLFPLNEYIIGGYEPFASYSSICGTWVKRKYLQLLEDIDLDITGGYF